MKKKILFPHIVTPAKLAPSIQTWKMLAAYLLDKRRSRREHKYR